MVLVAVQYIVERIVAFHPVPLNAANDLEDVLGVEEDSQVEHLTDFFIVENEQPLDDDDRCGPEDEHPRFGNLVVEDVFAAANRLAGAEFFQIADELAFGDRPGNVKIMYPVLIAFLLLQRDVVIVHTQVANLTVVQPFAKPADKGGFSGTGATRNADEEGFCHAAKGKKSCKPYNSCNSDDLYYLRPMTTFAIDLFRCLLGLTVLLSVCYLFSQNRKGIDWKIVGVGVAMQFVLAVLILKVPGVSVLFDYVATGFRKTLDFTAAGSTFLFGSIVNDLDSFGYIFAFQVLPTIVFFSALSAILYYLGILQKVVYGMAWLLSKALGLSGPESLAAAANVFIGQTEAPLVVKPYLEKMTRSELLCMMIGGMATIAGSVYVTYIKFLGGGDPQLEQFFAVHLLTASIISAPAAIVCAKILLPESPAELAAVTGGDGNAVPEVAKAPTKDNRLEMAADDSANLLDAISRGTTDGLRLAVNVGAMLLVFTALIFMLNVFFTGGADLVNWVVMGFSNDAWDAALAAGDTWNQQIAASTNNRFEGFSFTYLLALLFAPVAWIIGVSAQDVTVVGQLLGLKTVINEFVAYDVFQNLQRAAAAGRATPLTPKSTLIAAYALCGFANFASIGIQVGGIGAIAPGQRRTLTELGMLALLGGTIACLMTGAVAGVFY